MQISQYEQDNMRYTFDPPVEVGEVKIGSIHEIAAVALLGCDASNEEIVAAMRQFGEVLKSESGRVESFNVFLSGKHTVTGGRMGPGMPVWRTSPPLRGGAKIPGARLSPENRRRLNEQLDDIDRARYAVRGNDLLVYPPGYKN